MTRPAISLGVTAAPVVTIPARQARAFRVIDNRTSELTSWDTDLLPDALSGLNDLDIFSFDDVLPLAATAGSAVLRCAPALRVTRPASRLSRRRESETVMRIPTLVTVPSPGKRGRRLRPSLVGEGDRSGLGQPDSLGPPGRSDTDGLPGGVPVGLVATCQSLLRGSGEAEGDREVRVDVVCVGTEREAMPPRWFGAALDAQGDLD